MDETTPDGPSRIGKDEPGHPGQGSNRARLGFALHQGPEQATLALAEQEFFGWLRVDRLELDVPALAGSKTSAARRHAAARPESFQRRRTRLRAASLRLEQAHLDRYLAGCGDRLARAGVESLAVHPRDGFVAISAQVRDGKSSADVTCRLYVTPRGLGVRLLAGMPRVYGYLPVPAPVVAHGLCTALLGARPPDHDDARESDNISSARDVLIAGLGQFDVQPLRGLLWHTMPPAGWRLPSTAHVELTSARILPAGVDVAYGARKGAIFDSGDQRGASRQAQALAAVYEQLRDADDALLRGDVDAALRAYRGELAAGGPDQPVVVERILEVSAAHPAYFAEAAEFARVTLARWPESESAHAVLANIAMMQGDARAAGSHYQCVVELAGDDVENAVCAALCGARALRTVMPEAATLLYERVLEYVPAHAEAAAALVERYTAEGRGRELARLIKDGIAGITDPVEASRERLRLARVLGEQLDDAGAARAEIEHACELDPGNVQAFEALAEHWEALQQHDGAMAALDRAAALWAERGDVHAQARALMRTASLAERAGNAGLAAERYERALALDPDDAQALFRAASAAAQRGDHENAAALWNKLIASGSHPPRALARYHLELGRSLVATGDRGAAQRALDMAAHKGSGDIAGEAHALIAELSTGQDDPDSAARSLDAAILALTRAAESVFAHPRAEIPAPGAALERAGADDAGADDAAVDDAAVDDAAASAYSQGKRYLSRAAQLALDRALLLDKLDRHDDARADYQRAHRLARDVDPGRARQAARSLLRAEERRGDRHAQRRWIDALLAARPAADERVDLLLLRAELRAHDPDDAEGAMQDATSALAESSRDDRKAAALDLKARILAASGDLGGQARALAERAALVSGHDERARAEADCARAWLEAEDSGQALAAARRALAHIDQAGVDTALHASVLELLGELAWRHRAWDDVARCYGALAGPGQSSAGPGEDGAAHAIEHVRAAYRLASAHDALGDRDSAMAWFQRVLDSDTAPGDVRTTTWRSLAKLHERAGDLLRAARVYEALAADEHAKAGVDTRIEAWYRAGELHRKAGDHDSDAERCLEAALELAGDHMPALDALENLKREQGDHERVAEILERKIAAARQPEVHKALLARLASLQQHDLGQPELARQSHARALALDPQFRPSLTFMAAHHLQSDELAAAAAAYQTLARALPGDSGLAAAEDALLGERIAAALALGGVAAHVHARAAGTDGASRDVIADALAVIGELRELVPDSGELDERYHELLALAAGQGVEVPAADPARLAAHGDVAALRERADQAAEAEEWHDYAGCLEALIAATAKANPKPGERARRDSLFLELADVYYDRLDDPRSARKIMLAAAEAHGPGSRRDATLRMLAAEAEAERADEEAVHAYERIEPARRHSSDSFNLAACYQRLGYDHKAVTVLQEAEQADRLSDQGARLLFALRQEVAAKVDHARSLESRAARAAGERKAELLGQALELYDEALGDRDSAERVRAQLRAATAPDRDEAGAAHGDLESGDLDLTPAEIPAAKLRRLMDADAPGPARVVFAETPVLRPVPPPDRNAAVAPPLAAPAAPAKLVVQRATAEQKHAATRTSPGLGFPLHGRKGLESADPQALEQLADAALDMGDAVRAADYLAQSVIRRARALSDEGQGLDAATGQAVERLRQAAEQAGAYSVLVQGLTAAAEVAREPVIASALWAEVARVLDEIMAEHQRAADALVNAVEANPGDDSLVVEADELLRKAGNFHELAYVYELHLGTIDGGRRARTLFELGRLYRDVLGSIHRSADYFARAHEADPSFADAWLPLADQRVAEDDVAGALELYERAFEHGNLDADTRAFVQNRIVALSADPGVVAGSVEAENTAPDGIAVEAESTDPDGIAVEAENTARGGADMEELLLEARELETHAQWAAAIAVYERAARASGDPRSLEAIARLYRDLGDGEALVKVLDRLIAATMDRRARARLWLRQAKAYRDLLHREDETYRCLQEALAHDPKNPDLVHELRSAAMARGDWSTAAELLHHEIQAAQNPVDAGALHFELALIYDEKLGNSRQALAGYERALELDPDIPAAPRPLARLYEMEGRFAEAARMHEQAARNIRDDNQRSQLLQRAAACAERAGEVDMARRLYQLAVVAAVNDEARRSAAKSALARLNQNRAGQAGIPAPISATDSQRIKHLLKDLRNAGDHDAERIAREILALDGADPAAYAVLDARAEARRDWVAKASLLETRAAALVAPAEKAAAYYALGRLAETRLADTGAAIAAYERAMAADPGHSAAIEGLAAIAYERRDWLRAWELYARLDPASSTLAADTIFYRAGVAAEGLGRMDDALELFSRAAELAPKDPEKLTAKARVALRTGDLDAAVAASEAQLAQLAADDVQAISAARLKLADLCQRAGKLDAAIHYNELVLAENPRSQPALRSLHKLYLDRGTYEDAARALGALVTMTTSLPRRAELLYRLGELYRERVGDEDKAADAYLKGIDLDPVHVPTLRRLIDVYWREDEPGELIEIAENLAEQSALLDSETDDDALVRVMLAAAIRGDSELAGQIATWLGERLAGELVAVLWTSADRAGKNISIQALVEAVVDLCEHTAGLDMADLTARLSARGQDRARKLVAALRTTQSLRARHRAE